MRDEIRQRYSHLAEGVSVRGVCPSCEGGSTGEHSLSVTRSDGVLLYKCHRAMCSVRGRAATLGNQAVPAQSGTPRRLSGRERYEALGKGPLPAGVAAFLRHKYYLGERHFNRGGLQWTQGLSDPGYGRVVMPVRDRKGELYGFTARKIDSQNGPKTLSFIEDSRGAWYTKLYSKEIMLVEDQLSAIRVADYMNSVALLGTNVSESLVRELIAGGYTTVYVALDKDAYRKAISIVLDLRDRLPIKSIHQLTDAKDKTREELERWIKVNTGVTYGQESAP